MLPVALATSNPVTMRATHGGVARNVAEALARLGRPVELVSRVGNDPAGDEIVDALDRCGIDTSALDRTSDASTASYTALIEPDGSLAVALADMAIYDTILPETIDRALPVLARHSIWFADANLPRETLAHLLSLKPAGTRIAADAVSVPKAARLAGLLDRIDVLFVNEDEAAELVGFPVESDEQAEVAARALIAQGAGSVVLTRGAKGCLAAQPGKVERLAAPVAVPRDVTGAGDALIAGTLFGLTDGRGLAAGVRLGQTCAAIVLQSEETVPETLNPTLVFRALEDDLPSLEAPDS